MGSIFVLIALLRPVSCHGGPRSAPAPAGPADAAVWRDHFIDTWLLPARQAPPSIDFESQAEQIGEIHAEIRPVLAEAAPWNQWPGPEARLFNNRRAHLFEVRFTGPEPLTWLPDATRLELNRPGEGLPPARTPDELLLPLMEVALLEERHHLPGDLVEHTRGAGPFRAAYLPLAPGEGGLSGLIAFPTEPYSDEHQIVFGLRVTVAVRAGVDDYHFTWIFD